MKVQDILNYAITSSYSNNSSINNDMLLTYLNIEYHKLAKEIKDRVRSDFFYDIFTTNLVAGQNEYSFEPSTTDNVGIEHILSVEIKQSSDVDDKTWVRLAYRNSNMGALSLSQMQSNSYPCFDINDSSLFIFPTPTRSIIDGLRVQAITSLVDLKSDGEESSIYP